VSLLFGAVRVEEELPLKQGLKRLWNLVSSCNAGVEEELPLKQGLKQLQGGSIRCIRSIVEEELPLKQGLKRYRFKYDVDYISG